MLHDLPIECLQHIIGYLPSATAIINVALTNRALYDKISADNYGVLQYFVRRSFPSIKTESGWRASAIALTARSRAWDRRAVVARECYPPDLEVASRSQVRRQKFGFTPAIDSYETSAAGSRKEVVAWAAGGKIVLRSTTPDSVAYQTLRFLNDDDPMNDNLELRLLRPHQHDSSEGEQLLIRQANGQVASIRTHDDTDEYSTSLYCPPDGVAECIDVSSSRDPVLAVCNIQKIELYAVHSTAEDVAPVGILNLQQMSDKVGRQRCARFLSERTLAVAPQYLQGKQSAPIILHDLQAPVTNARTQPTVSHIPEDLSVRVRHCANVLAPLDNVCGNDGQLFLSGWSDGVARLHDIRTGNGCEISYTDKVDDGQILSLQPIGHQSFLAGSHQNGCLKTFDMRMPGAKNYSYLNARPSTRVPSLTQTQDLVPRQMQRDINIFLALRMPHRQTGWKPLPLTNNDRLNRYSGSIYSLSSPSPSSPTIYAGIEDHVIQLDFISTNDVRRGVAIDPALHLNDKELGRVLNLSCYQRPREGYESTDPVLLNHQKSFSVLDSSALERQSTNQGWDERWSLSSSGQGRSRRRSWTSRWRR